MTAVATTEATVPQHLLDAVAITHVLRTAAELGFVDRLLRGPQAVPDLASACTTDPAVTRLLLDTLAELAVVRRDPRGRYELAVAGLALVTMLDQGWSHLAEVVRTGRPVTPAHTAEGAAALYPDVVPSLSALFTAAAHQAARLLGDVGADVLDVGAGAAPWSIAVARSSPHVRVTALDLAAVIPSTRRAVEDAGLADRFAFLPGDMFTSSLPRGAYDTVLLANVCHLFDGGRNRALLQRLAPALRPGGRLAVVDVLPCGDAAARASVRLYALGLRLRTPQGAPHPVAAYEAWAGGAGLRHMRVARLSTAPPLHLLTWEGRGAEPRSGRSAS